MAEKKPSGFRFRLPWLQQPALPPRPAIAPEPPTQPRTTTQISVASTPARRPPFRPPGIAPAPAAAAPVAPPPTLATPAPALPTRAPPQSASLPVSAASPPPTVPAKSSEPKSPIAKTLDPVATQPTKETQITTETLPTSKTPGLATPPAVGKAADTVETQPTKETQTATKTEQATETASPATPPAIAKIADTIESQPTKETQTTTRTIPTIEKPGTTTPPAIAKIADTIETQPTKGTQTTTETIPTETPGPATPPQRPPFRPPSLPQSQPGPPQAPLPAKPDSQPSSPSRAGTQFRVSSHQVSPSRIPTPPQVNSQPLSPSRMAAQPHVPTKPSSPSHGATQSRVSSQPSSPVHVQPPQTGTPPRSPSRIASQPTDKTSPLPSHPTTTTTAVQQQEVTVNQAAQPPLSTPIPDDTPEIERSTEITQEKIPVDSNHVPQGADLALDAKPKEITKVKGAQTKSLNPYSMDKFPETKSQKPKPITAARLPLHREIRDDISKFIHKMATSPPKQYMDEKPASVITLAGDNIGASMNLGSDAIKREGAIDIQRGYKLTIDRTAHDAIINGEGSSNGKKSQRDSKASENQETKAILNSNIQGINNSIMFNSSVTERNPGVHLGFSRNLANTNDSKIKNTESMETHRAEANITAPQTLTYDPTIGRCLGGLSMEPSDSEPDDPEMSTKGYKIEVL